MFTIKKILPEYLRLDGGSQPRAVIDQAVCNEYAERMQAGEKFPPLDVFFDGRHHWLADGYHRLKAHMMALPGKMMECNVFEGTLADAKWHSYGVNKAHGLRRTNTDKRQAVMAALQHPHGWKMSDGQIAEYVGVSSKTVQIYRKELESIKEIPRSPNRIGRDGRTINTANIGKSRLERLELKLGKKEMRISKNAAFPVRGHSLPNSMIPLSLPSKNPVMAAAIICKQFDSDFVRNLIAELAKRLQGGTNHA